MDIYFVRHGKTEWNQEKRFQGCYGDSPLLPSSHEEIELVGKYLKDVPFAKAFCSTSKRAKDTVLGIQEHAKHPYEIVYTDDLREMALGELEGASILEMRKTHKELLDNLRYHPAEYDETVFGGESYEELIARSTKVIQEAVRTNKTGPLLIVSHGMTLTACIQTLLGKEIKDVRSMGGLDNNTVTIVRTAEDLQAYDLIIWNDGHFLKDREA